MESFVSRGAWAWGGVALLLVASFALHGALPHHHYEEGGDGMTLGAALHGQDRKWFFVLLALVGGLYSITRRAHSHERLGALQSLGLASHFEKSEELRDFLRTALRGGVMHPKLCG